MNKHSVHRELHGHYWTLSSHVRGLLRPERAPVDEPFVTHIDDEIAGRVAISGRIAIPERARDLVVILHGLGGTVQSRYMLLAARAVLDEGAACLRLHLRGADRSGSDFYHAGLTHDLDAVLSSERFARFERIFVMGYSLGGHVSLRWATTPSASDSRVRAIAAICPPIDLARGVREIQRLDRRPYQYYVLRSLMAHYAAVAAHHGVHPRLSPLPVSVVRRIRTILEWDERIIAPRYGFRSADHYYEEVGVGPYLRAIRVPTLLVAADADPMVPHATVRPALRDASESVRVVWTSRGGHVGFPDDLVLGIEACPSTSGLERQIVQWLLAQR